MKKIRLALSTVMICALAACSTTRNSAPVMEHPQANNHAMEIAKSSIAQGKPAIKPAQDPRGYYAVKKGDTLLQISFDYGQNYRDLIAWNDLADPNDIKIDQVLRVLPPEVAGGTVQTGSVASPAATEIKLAPGASASHAAVVPNKSTPRGDKRTYSEAAITEMQKPDAAGSPASAVAAVNKGDAAKATESKSVETQPQQAHQSGDDDALSWIWPADGKVIAGFDASRKGIDIAGQAGQQILAAGSGKVMYAGSGIRGYGNLVIVKHSSNLLSAYAHNKTILVKEGQTVSKGQKIAEMGNSDADSVKLHFEIRQQGKPVDPSKFLPNR